jgi:hypothetical protein
MSTLKNQQKKLHTREITAKVMQHFMGLNEENGDVLRRMCEKSSMKLVKAYMKTLKKQYKEILKTTEKNEAVTPIVYTKQTNSIAS